MPITKSIQCWLRKTNVRLASRAQTLSKFRKTCKCHLRSSFRAGEIFLFSATPTQAPQKSEKCFQSRTLFQGDCPRFPRSLSWKKSRAFRRVWHKPECILEARAFFAFPETKESKTTGRLCSSLTIHISIVEVFNSMRTYSLWTSEYPPCIWWYV